MIYEHWFLTAFYYISVKIYVTHSLCVQDIGRISTATFIEECWENSLRYFTKQLCSIFKNQIWIATAWGHLKIASVKLLVEKVKLSTDREISAKRLPFCSLRTLLLSYFKCWLWTFSPKNMVFSGKFHCTHKFALYKDVRIHPSWNSNWWLIQWSISCHHSY